MPIGGHLYKRLCRNWKTGQTQNLLAVCRVGSSPTSRSLVLRAYFPCLGQGYTGESRLEVWRYRFMAENPSYGIRQDCVRVGMPVFEG